MTYKCYVVAAVLIELLHAASLLERAQRLRQLQQMWEQRQRDRLSRSRLVIPQQTTEITVTNGDITIWPLTENFSTATLPIEGGRNFFDWSTFVNEDESYEENLSTNGYKEGDIRLSGGRSKYEGNVEIFHSGLWGFICDDEWELEDAQIVCKQLDNGQALKPTHNSFFGHPERAFYWIDNIHCIGTERNLSKCHFEAWGLNDCSSSEIAGVVCRPMVTESSKSNHWPSGDWNGPNVKKVLVGSSLRENIGLRLAGGRSIFEGRLEMKVFNGEWGVVCGNGWGLLEANIACKTMGMGFAASAEQTNFFGGENMNKSVSGIQCIGNETSLYECYCDLIMFCSGNPETNIATVVCQTNMADLVPDLQVLMNTAYVEDKEMFYLQCAMEEDCLAADAYRIRREYNDWHLYKRRLLRFTTKVLNVGTDFFRPLLPKQAWEWHACHMHYHSMEVFSVYYISDYTGKRIAEGHKASFCLEDSHCNSNVEPIFNCANFGDQGISVGCADSYAHNIDCQWLDISDMAVGSFILRIVINSEFKVGEQTWENNAVECKLYYSGSEISVTDCRLTRP